MFIKWLAMKSIIEILQIYDSDGQGSFVSVGRTLEIAKCNGSRKHIIIIWEFIDLMSQ